jgi:uncharacterized damage-inducible protein DinB
MLAMFQTLYRYNWWATTQVLTALQELSPDELHRDLGGSFPTIHAGLLHILWVEQMFLRRWQRQSTQDLTRPPELGTIADIQAVWQRLTEDCTRYLNTLTEADLQAPLAYQDSRGRQIELLFWQALFHCANHSTFHRGQIVSKLRQTGHTPPNTDFVSFCREVQ